MLGSEYATNFIRFGQMYKVMVQASPEYRAAPEDLLKIQVRSDSGEMVPLASVMTVRKTYGPDQLTRYNMYPSAFWICLIFVYLVLSAQYESFVLPMVVVFSLPPGVFGAFLGLKLIGLDNNIYAHLALIMLIGLLGKNAILIVEFAQLKRREGRSPFQAAVEAARLRLRPILMTSLAFFVGLLPLVVATGAGAVGNRTVGTAAAGGMLLGTIWGVVLVPGLYVIFTPVAPRPSGKRGESSNSDEPTLASNETTAAGADTPVEQVVG